MSKIVKNKYAHYGMLGKEHSKETKKKMSKSAKDYIEAHPGCRKGSSTSFKKGEIPYWKTHGLKHPQKGKRCVA